MIETMMTKTLTLAHFDKMMAAIQTDLRSIQSSMATRVEVQELHKDVRSIRNDLDQLTDEVKKLVTTLDGYVKRTETWHQEQIVLRLRIERLERVLVQKNLVSHTELSA